jgi:uncharacterized protein (TIGR02118 family)
MTLSERDTKQSRKRSRTMIVRTGILTRKPDLTPEQFRAHWLNTHGPLAAKMPGLRRYHQNHITDRSQLAIDHARGTWEVDGFSQLWFDDLDAMRKAVSSPEFPPTVPDIANFCGDIRVVTCQPNIVVPVAANAGPLVKRMSILTRRPDITAEKFRDEWFGFHAAAVEKFPNLVGYTQNLVIERAGADLTNPATYEQAPVDGIVELWFRNTDDVRTAFSSPAAEISQRHALDFIGTITTYLVKTHAII